MKVMMTLMLLLLFLPPTAEAAIRDTLIIRLNELIDDAGNNKMSAANKVLFLNTVGREYGARGAYMKRDTIIMVANQELYSLNTDFAGTIRSAYKKLGQERTVLPVMSREEVDFAPTVEYGVVEYIYFEMDSSAQMGVHNLPLNTDTIIIQYFAFPEEMNAGSDEWPLSDQYENAALYECASQILSTIPTAQAQSMSQNHGARAEMLFNRVRRPTIPTAEVGAQP